MLMSKTPPVEFRSFTQNVSQELHSQGWMNAKGWGVSLGRPQPAKDGAKPQDPRERTGGEARETARGEEAQGPGGEGPPRSPGRWGSARQRDPEAAGQGTASR